MYAKKTSAKKIAVLLLAVVLLIGGTVGGTLAWLSAQTNEVTNTFAVGKIEITLTETFNAKSDDTLTTNDKWVGKIVPGGTEAKDPTVTVKAGSEKCYVYALVENNMKIDGVVVVTPNISANEWEAIGTNGNETLYRYIGTNADANNVVNAASADVKCEVFTQVTYNGDKIDETNITALAANTIIVDAYAHQAENTTQAVANAEAIKHFGVTAINP